VSVSADYAANPYFYCACMCMCACMVRKQRVETYLNPETVEKIAKKQKPASAFIREAVRQELQRYEQEEYKDD